MTEASISATMQAMTGDRERTTETPRSKDPNWERLGRLLKQRRPQLDLRYRIRRVFAEENNLTDKTVQEIENAYRETFSPEMLSAIEVAYRLPSGTVAEVLADPNRTTLPPPTPPVRAVPGQRSGTAVEIPAGVSLEDLPDEEAAIWQLPDTSVHERELLIHMLRVWRGDRGESLDELYRALAALARQRDGERSNGGSRHAG